MTERAQVWQQVEELAKNNPVWEKMIGQMERIDLSTKDNSSDDFNMADGDDLKIECLDEMTREVDYIHY